MELLDNLLQLTLSGLSNGALYALIALGIVLIYKASDVINFAQGEFLLIGAYMTFWAVTVAGLPWPIGVLIAIAVAALTGVLTERFVLRPLIGEPIISVIMVTIGLSSLIRAIIGFFFGTSPRPFPAFIPNQNVYVLGAVAPADRLWGLALSVVLIIGFVMFFRRSNEGIAMRAVADDQQAAMSMGISIQRIFALTWAIAAVVAAIAGILVANIVGVSADVSRIGLRVFPVVILGGLDSIPGAIIGGIIIGLLESYSGGFLSRLLGISGLELVIPFVVLVLILMFKPYGLFGQRRIERV